MEKRKGEKERRRRKNNRRIKKEKLEKLNDTGGVGDNCAGRGKRRADANARNNLLERYSGLAIRSKIHVYAYGNPVRGGQQSLRVA